MVQGDAKGVISSIAAGALLTVQPSAEEEWIIKRLFSLGSVGTSPNKIADVGFVFYDGTNASNFGDYVSPENSLTLYIPPLQLYVDNTIYFRLRNNWGGTLDIGYCGIQTK